MAFILKDFQPVGASARSGSPSLDDAGEVILPPGANAKAVWVYGSNDTLTAIGAAGYFNEVRDLVNPNDALLIAGDGSNRELRWNSFLLVPKSSSITPLGDVTLSALGQNAG